MPYIKYKGGRPPSSISEQVNFEDPNAPCYQGLADLMAEGRRFTEEKYSDTSQRVNALEDYMSSHQYPGLEHVGGVGMVQPGILRPTDAEICVEEYQLLRSEIEKSNHDYREQKAHKLAINNDPLRRADWQHESFGWRGFGRPPILSLTITSPIP